MGLEILFDVNSILKLILLVLFITLISYFLFPEPFKKHKSKIFLAYVILIIFTLFTSLWLSDFHLNYSDTYRTFILLCYFILPVFSIIVVPFLLFIFNLKNEALEVEINNTH
jgi:hypothetical protein